MGSKGLNKMVVLLLSLKILYMFKYKYQTINTISVKKNTVRVCVLKFKKCIIKLQL